MALGFGFNKAKVLAAAEKHVQQGKLNQAIAEYEKIMARDARDLTVQNTIGDLYARIGQNEKAAEFFKRVGDTYAADGFTVKAIAMYKKLTKLSPGNIATVQRLAEFYTQQGLYNDARQQYLQLADSHIKANDLTSAVRVFQKMLDMDPDNATLQSRLAELFTKMGKKAEARDIYLRAATSLYERGSVQQADDALNRMLALDPSNVDALLMRGKIALDAGDGTSAVRFLEKVPDIDTRYEGLNSLLRAYILCNEPDQAGGIARKLAQVHNNLAGVRIYADYLAASGKGPAAVAVYEEFAGRLVVGDSGELNFALQNLINQVKEDHIALEKLRGVFQKTGYVTNIPEVNELLAHACVKAGELIKARDLYKELAELEPSNPQHQQNYRQVLVRMGEDPTSLISAADADQALFIEEIEEVPLPPTAPDYPAELVEKVSNVLMDAELFESYNKPQQALAPLEAVLKQAPRDVRLNQRLLSVYVRLGKTADARDRCETLHSIYSEAGMEPEAKRYKELAVFFAESAAAPPPVEEVQEFSVIEPQTAPATPTTETSHPAFRSVAVESDLPVFAVEAGEAHEIDLSSEWDTVEVQNVNIFAPANLEAPPLAAVEVARAETEASIAADLLEEIKFYLGQQMFDEARSAMVRCEQLAPGNQELAGLRRELDIRSASLAAARAEDESTVELMDADAFLSAGEMMDEGTVVDYDFDTQISHSEPSHTQNAHTEVAETYQTAAPEIEVAPAARTTSPLPAENVVVAFVESVAEAHHVESAASPAVTEQKAELQEQQVLPSPQSAAPQEDEYLSVEDSATAFEGTQAVTVKAEEDEEEEESFEASSALRQPFPPSVPAVEPEPVSAATTGGPDPYSDLVLDLENALGPNFGQPAYAANTSVSSGPAPSSTMPQIAASMGSATMAPATMAPIPMTPMTMTPAAMSPAASGGAAVMAEAPVVVESVGNTTLSDMFAEFKEEVGEAAEEKEDPETHYNLGVAFKEMGLLDEAIGEFQKVCKSIDHGTPFSQVMQAYTWLAHCFIEKGVPEASIKWYEKALVIPSPQESQTALHYDLACAYEASGERRLALKHFTEVYGTNIDYRDVAERIKALKS